MQIAGKNVKWNWEPGSDQKTDYYLLDGDSIQNAVQMPSNPDVFCQWLSDAYARVTTDRNTAEIHTISIYLLRSNELPLADNDIYNRERFGHYVQNQSSQPNLKSEHYHTYFTRELRANHLSLTDEARNIDIRIDRKKDNEATAKQQAMASELFNRGYVCTADHIPTHEDLLEMLETPFARPDNLNASKASEAAHGRH